MKFLSGVIICAFVALFFLYQKDDNLSDEAVNLVKRVDALGESEAFIYLFGIDADESESPINVGSKTLEYYRKQESESLGEVVGYQEPKKLPLPTGTLFCKAWEENCLKLLFTSEINIEKLSKDNEVLISRASVFYDYDEYKSLLKPSVSEALPPYQYIAAANRLKLLSAIAAHKGGNSVKAVELLLNHISLIRRSLALQDNLIGKLIFLMGFSEVVDVLSIINSESEIKSALIPNLSETEKDFKVVSAREFAMSYYLFKNLDKNPEIFEIGGNAPAWITRLLYKPNMTLNAIVSNYYRPERLIQLSHFEFAKEIENSSETIKLTSFVRNYAGNVLIEAIPSYDEYVGRFMDFDAKLTIYNQVHHFQVDLDDVKNPYYENISPQVGGEMLCLTGPLDDTRFLRCLRIKANL